MRPESEPPDPGEPAGPEEPSYGPMSDAHWSRSRRGSNREALEYYRQKSRAPGVAEGGAPRNQYCLECGGVVPLSYDSREPLARGREPERCPHCRAELEGRVRQMFNWVETDQVPEGDAKAVLPFFLLALALIAGLAYLGLRACGT